MSQSQPLSHDHQQLEKFYTKTLEWDWLGVDCQHSLDFPSHTSNGGQLSFVSTALQVLVNPHIMSWKYTKMLKAKVLDDRLCRTWQMETLKTRQGAWFYTISTIQLLKKGVVNIELLNIDFIYQTVTPDRHLFQEFSFKKQQLDEITDCLNISTNKSSFLMNSYT